MYSITEDLLKELKNATDIEVFLKEHNDKFINKTPHTYLNELIAAKGIKISAVASGSGAGEYVYKIFAGERNPSRDIMITMSFGMGLTLEETQLLLRISKFAILDSRDKRDSVILYGLTSGMSVFETDDMLYSQKLRTLN
ncbi:MAG: XRE family transcriptional regulator [Clostridia bacterium]|nr:XRE family transcriptional regulator [Clostridia bacterium]